MTPAAVSLNDNSSVSSGDGDDHSMVVVEPPEPSRPPSPSPERTVRRRTSGVPALAAKTKRRSMSVGEAELRLAMASAAGATPLPAAASARPGTGGGLDELMRDWRGALSGLDGDGPASALALLDPSTPARRPTPLTRSQSDSAQEVTPTATSPAVAELGHSSLYASDGSAGSAPTVTLQPPTGEAPHVVKNVVPPRSMSLQVGPTRRERPSSVLYGARPTAGRAASQPTRPPHILAAPRSATHLRLQSNTSASNSEPSLLHPADKNSGR
jgi:hypothetical protein